MWASSLYFMAFSSSFSDYCPVCTGSYTISRGVTFRLSLGSDLIHLSINIKPIFTGFAPLHATSTFSLVAEQTLVSEPLFISSSSTSQRPINRHIHICVLYVLRWAYIPLINGVGFTLTQITMLLSNILTAHALTLIQDKSLRATKYLSALPLPFSLSPCCYFSGYVHSEHLLGFFLAVVAK